MKPRMLGDIHLCRVLETELPELDPRTFFLAYSDEALAPHRHWLEPDAIDPASGLLRIAVQSYVVRTGRHVILIDTCVGEHKEREFLPDWNMRSGTSFLADLAKAGVRPEEVTHVMCTHLHPDHVGWNTKLVDGRWVPTFPNAQYVFAKKEYDFWEPKWRRDPKKFGDGCFGDSVLPVMEAGQAVLVAEDHAIDDTVWLEPTPGHSAGHTAIHMRSKGEDAVMSGDLIHSPVQLAFPEWSTRGCLDKALSAATRRGFLERYCDSRTLVLTAHFPSPSIGWVTRKDDAFRFRYAE